MRVLVTGASGMLGSTLVQKWRARHEVLATGSLDFVPPSDWRYLPFDLQQPDYAPLIDWAQPQAIVHCAARTAVDACEQDPEGASMVNGRSVERLGHAAPNVRLLYISSDAVLGERQSPAHEDACPAPLNAYGRSKWLGEQLLGERGVAVRTTVIGWNLDRRKQSFVEWLVRSLERREPITLFEDTLFNPIAASALGDELESLLMSEQIGVCHVSGHESLSKLELGRRLCQRLGLDESLIRVGRLADARFTAARSADQRLDVTGYEARVGHRLPTIDEMLDTLVRDRPMNREQSA